MDFVIALLLFTFTLVVYFSYTNNFQKQSYGNLDLLVKDANSISTSLTLSGYPINWNNETVIRIGVTDNQKLNSSKVKLFKKLNYTKTKNMFATYYDYFVYFVNDKDEVLNIDGICGAGYPLITTTYNVKSAYYYSSESDAFLKDFMSQTFAADIFFNDIETFASNLSSYNFIVMEHPLLTTSEYNQYKDHLNNYSSTGGLLMISGELVTAQDRDLVGVGFNKKSGLSASQRTAIVNNTDPYLELSIGQSMTFNQYYYVENKSEAVGFKIIATFNNSDDKAIAKWTYGNGTVYFFSDFDVSNFNGDFIGLVEETTKALVQGTCSPINLSIINPKDLVKAERYISYNSRPVKMIVYLWQ